jgi:methyltransferase
VLTAIAVALVALLGVTRLFELRVSRAHRRSLVERGARPVADPGFRLMACLHVGVLGGALLEPLLTGSAAPVWLGAVAATGVVGASVLRITAIHSLGLHWNVRVIDSTGLGVVSSGPYRFIRHPNYVAVFLELLLLPLVQGAWITAAVGSALHVFVLRRRILLEEAVLFAHPAYRASMQDKPRFFPRVLGRSRAHVRTERA